MQSKTDILSINTIRLLAAEGVQKAKSGHPGMPMGTAPIAYTLWAKHMKHNPTDTKWADRDRFVLSAGHGSMLIYSLLHVFGYEMPLDELKQFRQLGSLTPGHPEFGHVPGVETTTGPLGMGIANAVGFAMAEKRLAAEFNREGYPVVDHYTYVLHGDGCLMEGISHEACSLAGTLKLGKLIMFYDDNDISIEGSTDIAFTEDVAKRFLAYGWQVIKVDDGNNTDAISAAIRKAKKETEKPSIIICKTQIGYGCPDKQGKASAHGEPLGEDNIAATKKFLDWPYEEPFYVPDEVKAMRKKVVSAGKKAQGKWEKMFDEYCEKYPELAKKWNEWFAEDVAYDFENDEEFWKFGAKGATRNTSGEVLARIAAKVENLMGGSADLAPSNKTYIKGRGDFGPDNYAGNNFHFGVREFAMGAIANAMSLHGGIRPYVGTFFVFSDYMKHAVRLSCLMEQPVIYVFTHDSIGVGEDGPTHQPIEQLAMLRSIPNMTVVRPADAKEVAAGYLYALKHKGPVAMILTRQDLVLQEKSGVDAMKGAYILSDSTKETPDVIIIATGSEVEPSMQAKALLAEKGVDARVVSMPSMEIFERQSDEYKESVLPKAVRARVCVEALSEFGWHKYAGLDGEIIAMTTFGASAPYAKLFPLYGFTAENIAEKALKVAGK
ncbi:MAG: transketolase [Clostridiales bacterium]|nr:transketolase [Clostridiales bacterium]